MSSQGDYVYMTMVYDPWLLGDLQVPAPGMESASVDLNVRGIFRHEQGSTTGGVKAQFRMRILRYVAGSCKADSFDEFTTWQTKTDMLPLCSDPGTVFTGCDRQLMNIGIDTTNDAIVWRSFMRSWSSGPVWLDKTGVYGGTS